MQENKRTGFIDRYLISYDDRERYIYFADGYEYIGGVYEWSKGMWEALSINPLKILLMYDLKEDAEKALMKSLDMVDVPVIEIKSKDGLQHNVEYMPPVDLGWNDQEGLIIKDPEGKFYTNQAGGYACLHPVARGWFIPMKMVDNLENIWRYVEGNSVYTGNKPDLTKEIKETHEAFKGCNGPEDCLVDETENSMEAWVHVKVGPIKGILVWGNTD